MIEEATKEFPGYRFERLDMTEIEEFEGGKYDLVFFIASFHHLKTLTERQNLLFRLKDVVKK